MNPTSFPRPIHSQSLPSSFEPDNASRPSQLIDTVLDSEEAAKVLKIHPKTLQRYVREGAMKGFKVGSQWRFRASDLQHWIAQQAS